MATILSPAGNMDALKCAVNNGTDAVYLGLDSFNARMKADNFTIDTLPQVVAYCHLFGVKVYVTLNTSIKQSELDMAYKLVDDIFLSNADGIIVTDIALLVYCSRFSTSNFDIVASTQMNIHDIYGARYVETLGATTVVLARECTIQDVRAISSGTKLKVECFIHGAMCVCQSGQCLMSSIAGGNSGNRGLCAQPCRQLYTSYNGSQRINRGYMLSPKDLCGLDIAKQLSDAGVSVYKIEGRNRRAQYSGIASRTYKQLFTNNFKYATTNLQQLKLMFNRGNYLSGQYLNGNNGDIIHSKAQGHIGLDIGYINNGKLITTHAVADGDAFKVMSDDIEVGNGIVVSGGTGKINISLKGNIANGDRVCLTSSSRLMDNIDSVVRKLDVALTVSGSVNSPLTVVATCDNVTVSCSSEVACSQAVNTANIQDNLTKQLSKTGNSHYTITDIVYQIDEIYLPMSAINAVRRDIIDQLTDAIVSQYHSNLARVSVPSALLPAKLPHGGGRSIMVFCYDIDSLQSALVDTKVDIVVYYAMTIDNNIVKNISGMSDKTIYIDIAPFAQLDYILQCIQPYNNIGIVCNNIGAVALAQQHNIAYIIGSGMNIYNSASAMQLAGNDNMYVYSHELTLVEIDNISSANGYTYVDGPLVAMKTVHCPYKANGYNCNNCEQADLKYVDNKGNAFYIARRSHGICNFDIINGTTLCVMSKEISPNNMCMGYNSSVVTHYNAINSGKPTRSYSEDNYTKGRLFDKVK